jgi:hypothetical protein
MHHMIWGIIIVVWAGGGLQLRSEVGVVKVAVVLVEGGL